MATNGCNEFLVIETAKCVCHFVEKYKGFNKKDKNNLIAIKFFYLISVQGLLLAFGTL